MDPALYRTGEVLAAKSNGAKSPEEIKKAATQFEALLVQQMLKSMWATVPHQEGSITGSKEEETYRDMLQEAMAKDIAEKSSLGVADVIARDMQQIEARTHHESSKPVTGK